jgi:hypothetical protein
LPAGAREEGSPKEDDERKGGEEQDKGNAVEYEVRIAILGIYGQAQPYPPDCPASISKVTTNISTYLNKKIK